MPSRWRCLRSRTARLSRSERRPGPAVSPRQERTVGTGRGCPQGSGGVSVGSSIISHMFDTALDLFDTVGVAPVDAEAEVVARLLAADAAARERAGSGVDGAVVGGGGVAGAGAGGGAVDPDGAGAVVAGGGWAGRGAPGRGHGPGGDAWGSGGGVRGGPGRRGAGGVAAERGAAGRGRARADRRGCPGPWLLWRPGWCRCRWRGCWCVRPRTPPSRLLVRSRRGCWTASGRGILEGLGRLAVEEIAVRRSAAPRPGRPGRGPRDRGPGAHAGPTGAGRSGR